VAAVSTRLGCCERTTALDGPEHVAAHVRGLQVKTRLEEVVVRVCGALWPDLLCHFRQTVQESMPLHAACALTPVTARGYTDTAQSAALWDCGFVAGADHAEEDRVWATAFARLPASAHTTLQAALEEACSREVRWAAGESSEARETAESVSGHQLSCVQVAVGTAQVNDTNAEAEDKADAEADAEPSDDEGATPTFQERDGAFELNADGQTSTITPALLMIFVVR